MFGALLEVEMSKKCMLLGREAHVEVKMHKTHQGRSTFGSWHVEKVHAVVARSTFRSQQCKRLVGLEHFWAFRCRFAWQAQAIMHRVKSEQNATLLSQVQLQPPLRYVALHYNYNCNCNYTTLSTFRYTTLHSTTLHSLHYNNSYNYSYNYHYTTLH